MHKHAAKRSCSIFLTLILVLVSLIGIFKLNQSAFAVTNDSSGYTYLGNIGNVTTTWANNGDLVNPTMATYAVGLGTYGLVYVYCDSTAMPYATGGLISAQATPNNWRTIVIFQDNGDGTFSYKSMVTVQVAGSGIGFTNNGKPLGFVVDGPTGYIYMTAPTGGYLAARYASTPGTSTVAAPTLMGPMTGFWQQTVNGKPSFDLAGNYILVPGQFQTQHGTYAVAHINLGTGNPVTDAPSLFNPYPTNGDTYWMETIAANNDGVHFAGGSFTLGGKPFNIVRSYPDTGQIVPISPPNISGVNNEQQAGIYNIYSISVDDASNIYASGNFGVTQQSQYEVASILKIDENGNFVNIIAPESNTSSTLGSISGTNAVTINRTNQWVFVVDANNTSGNAVKIFAFNGTLPGSGGETPAPCGPPTSTNVDTDTGTVSVISPGDGSSTTISNQSQDSFNQNQPPTAVLQILPDGIVNDTSVRIGTSLIDADTGDTVTTSWVVNPDGSTSIALTVRESDGTLAVRNGTGTPTTNPDGSTTSTIYLLSPDGTTLINTVTVASNPAGGKTITTTKTIDVLGGGTYTTVVVISSDSSGNITVSLTLPNIVTGDSYVTTVSTNNGAQACNLTSIPWTAGQSDAFITLSEAYCSSSPFNIIIDPTASGTLGTDCATITTVTNNPTGYNTTLNTSSANLTCTTGSGTYNLTPASSTLAALSNNQWGYYIGWDTPSTFQAVPTTPTIIQSNTGAAVGDQFMFWIGAQLDYSQPPCVYSGTITMTASVEPVPAPTITSISPTSGSTTAGNIITITGTNFGTASSPYLSKITVGGTSCLIISVIDNNTATCATPNLSVDTYDVTVDGFGGSATLPSSWSAS